MGVNPSRQTGPDIAAFIQGGRNGADATLAPGVKIASATVLANLVEIKVQHGGAGQVVVKTDVRGDPTVAVGSTVFIQPLDNPLSTIAVKIETTLFENDHSIFGVRTARFGFNNIDALIVGTTAPPAPKALKKSSANRRMRLCGTVTETLLPLRSGHNCC